MAGERASPYATDKLLHHLDLIGQLRRGEHPAPLLLQASVENRCQADCHYCAYRISNWRNDQLFSDRDRIPLPVLEELIRDAAAVGVKAFEITGGGEPLIYPHRERMFDLLFEVGLETSLVTNGVALSDALAEKIAPRLIWSRVSIESVRADRYMAIRSVEQKQFDMAWEAVSKLAAGRCRPEQRVGVGFVLVNENIDEVYDFCAEAKRRGADNVRLSLRFGPEGNDYYTDKDALERAFCDAERAKAELEDDRFQVNDLLRERFENQGEPVQNYHRCLAKDVMAYVGGDSRVYTCCTLAFHPSGLVGDLKKKRFKDLWFSPEVVEMYANLDPRRVCRLACLYEKRNKEMLRIVEPPKLHENFI